MLAAITTIAFVCCQIIGAKIVRESVTIVQDFGIQLRSYNLHGKVTSQRFVDLARVRDVCLNESLSYWALDQYCAFICEREESLVVPFRNLKIRQENLIGVYCTLKQFLSSF